MSKRRLAFWRTGPPGTRPEPSALLRASTTWSLGIGPYWECRLSSCFRRGVPQGKSTNRAEDRSRAFACPVRCYLALDAGSRLPAACSSAPPCSGRVGPDRATDPPGALVRTRAVARSRHALLPFVGYLGSCHDPPVMVRCRMLAEPSIAFQLCPRTQQRFPCPVVTHQSDRGAALRRAGTPALRREFSQLFGGRSYHDTLAVGWCIANLAVKLV